MQNWIRREKKHLWFENRKKELANRPMIREQAFGNRLKEKIETLKQQMRRLERLKVEMLATPDQQISLTYLDARSMATSGRGSGVVGYNVQIAVEANHHLIVMHEVTNDGTDRSQPLPCGQRDQGGAGRGEARCRRLRLSPSCPFRLLHTLLALPASEELPPPSDTARPGRHQ